jgi:hypothetical protein
MYLIIISTLPSCYPRCRNSTDNDILVERSAQCNDMEKRERENVLIPRSKPQRPVAASVHTVDLMRVKRWW